MAETLAFVIPWYGPSATGGAEAECRATARALAARSVPVEILTTCARNHASAWADYYPEGPAELDGIAVRRFKVRARDAERYRRYDWRLRQGEPLSPLEEEEFVADSINSAALYAYLTAEQERYWYAFIPYCFGTSWEGILAAPARSLLIPCLHAEGYARLAATARALRAARAVCFHVPAERALGAALAGDDGPNFFLVGEGVDTDAGGDPERFRRKYRIHDPFLLYAGRKAAEKNTPLLLDYYTRYRVTHPDTALKLVLIGGGGIRIPERWGRDMLDLGYVSAQDKLDAYAACLALCQPSLLESFSIVMMEAWLGGAPVLVHAGCAVTRDHCLASHGGLFFEEYFEFVEAVDRLLGDTPLRRRMAENGRAYVLANFTWNRVTDNYRRLLGSLGARLA